MTAQSTKSFSISDIGNKIRATRESINLSQEYVAAKLEISQQAYSRLEKNPQNITVSRLYKLSEILGVPFSSLTGEEEFYIQQNYNQQGGNASTVMHIQGLSDNERKLYEERINDLKEQIVLLQKILTQNSSD
jgi:transcriptional regulator with XRE-family HTH domain